MAGTKLSYIIGIKGKSGCGKDTFANMLKHELELKGKRVKICHFATALKRIASECFEWKGHKDDSTELGRKGRRLLQLLGTEVGRECVRQSFWTDKIRDLIDNDVDDVQYWLIPDTRFHNEVEFVYTGILSSLGMIVEIVRPGLNTSGKKFQHKSETDLDCLTPDHIIMNDEGFAELSDRVKSFVTSTLL